LAWTPGSEPLSLCHVSDRPDIAEFTPRPPQGYSPAAVRGDVVWAIDESLLHNYLLPRDCPRVTCYALPGTDPADVARLLGTTAARHVVAVESGWLRRIREAVLYVYTLPRPTFVPVDAGAGYYVSHQAVRPLEVARVDDVLGALVARDVELRVMPSLWPLRDAVVASTLQYSCIRMRNARPRPLPGQ
jgi:hypothetical protein